MAAATVTISSFVSSFGFSSLQLLKLLSEWFKLARNATFLRKKRTHRNESRKKTHFFEKHFAFTSRNDPFRIITLSWLPFSSSFLAVRRHSVSSILGSFSLLAFFLCSFFRSIFHKSVDDGEDENEMEIVSNCYIEWLRISSFLSSTHRSLFLSTNWNRCKWNRKFLSMEKNEQKVNVERKQWWEKLTSAKW